MRQLAAACARAQRRGCFPSGKSHLSRVRLFQLVRAMAGARRDRARAGQPARPAPRLRDPSARGRRGPARAPVAARPCRHRDDANLHPCRQRAAGRAGQCAASACAPDRVVDDEARCRLTPRRQCRPISNSKSRSPSSTRGSPSCATPRAPATIDIDAEVAQARGQVGQAAARDLCQADARGRRRRSRAIPSGRTSRIMSPASPRISCRWPATARLPTTRRSSAAWRGSTAAG